MRDSKSPAVIPLSDFRAKPGATIDRLKEGRPVFLARRGRTCAVLLSIGAYDELEEREPKVPVPPKPKFSISADATDVTRVLEAVEAGCGYQPDAIVKATGLPASRVQVALLELEINGLVKRPRHEDAPKRPRR